MKNLFASLIFMFFASGVFAQHHFKVEDNKLIWQKVYELTDSVNVRDKLIEKNILANIMETNEKMIAELKPEEIDYKSYGYNRLHVPMYISQSSITGKVSIEFKDKKYRVTLSDINLIQNTTNALAKDGDKTAYETFAINNQNEFRNVFIKYDTEIVEKNFDKLFSITSKKSDW